MSNESLKTESAWLLSGLYQGGLFIGNEPVAEKVETKEIQIETPQIETPMPQFSAKFIHWIEENSDFDYKDMISKIMFALKWKGQEIKAEDFIFLNSNEVKHSFEELLNAGALKAERILFWSNRVTSTNGSQVLQVLSPSSVAKDKDTKIKYWNQIKSYFGL